MQGVSNKHCFFFILQLDVYDWDSDGSHDMIGGFTTTVEELAASQHGKEVSA